MNPITPEDLERLAQIYTPGSYYANVLQALAQLLRQIRCGGWNVLRLGHHPSSRLHAMLDERIGRPLEFSTYDDARRACLLASALSRDTFVPGHNEEVSRDTDSEKDGSGI